MLDEALYLLSLNLSVIPLVVETKLPPKSCTWKEQQDSLPSEDLIIKRFTDNPGCNIGIITGRGSQVVVIDGDSQEACEWIERTFPHNWLTVINSGRGRHYYYKYPSLKEDQKIKSTGGVIHDSVDVRADGGLVVCPPSIHKSGNLYTWEIAEK